MEKDLGVLLSSDLKMTPHCEVIYKRASQKLGLLKRLFGRFVAEIIAMIMPTYIRPTMKYAIQAWSPWLMKDIDLLQRVYHRATKMVGGLKNLPYEERKGHLNLSDIER